MPSNGSRPVRFASGRATNRGKVENRVLSWTKFKEQFREPLRTAETQRDYFKRSEDEQKRLKELNGWWFRSQTEGKVRNRKSALPSDLITLDFDYPSPDFFEACRWGLLPVDWDYFIHTSRRHTPEKPRFRMVILTKTPIPNDDYSAASRIVAWTIDSAMEWVDKVSFRAAQMMYMPTASKGAEYVFAAHAGEPCDWEGLRAKFDREVGDSHDLSKLPKCRDEHLRQVADKAEVPTEKDGPVGYFCRAYTVPEAIDAFDLPYIPVDGEPNRYSYAHGTTSNGAEVYDDGLFLYSHHGSDPCGDMLVNAFDLVRLHRFGDQDTDTYDKIGDRPSFKAMLALCGEDPGYCRERTRAQYDDLAMFDSLDDDAQEEIAEAEVEDHEPMPPEWLEVIGPFNGYSLPETVAPAVLSPVGTAIEAPRARRRPKPPKDWIDQLETDKLGQVLPTVFNVAKIIAHDVRIRDAIGFNDFLNDAVMLLPIKTKEKWLPVFDVPDRLSGEPYEDRHRNIVRIILEAPNGPGKIGWGLKVSDRDLDAGILTAAHVNHFHPVRETLQSFEWDGVARADRLFIDYLGCPDHPYFREAARCFLVAAVTRIFEPGHKFDFCPVLWGSQGIRKSTFIKTLAMGWFGELTADFDDEQKLAEQIKGCWISELPELASTQRSKVEDVKAFLSRTVLPVRMAYDRRVTHFRAQTVFMGSVNNIDFLKDETGNRRFWPIEVIFEEIDTDRLARELPLIWAEALAIYRAMRAEQPTGTLPLYLRSPEAAERALELQEQSRRKGDLDIVTEVLGRFLDMPITDDFDGTRRRRDSVTSLDLIDAWNASGARINGSINQHLGTALRKLGWSTDTGSRMGAKRPRSRKKLGNIWITRYYPTQAVLARWAEADAPHADVI